MKGRAGTTGGGEGKSSPVKEAAVAGTFTITGLAHISARDGGTCLGRPNKVLRKSLRKCSLAFRKSAYSPGSAMAGRTKPKAALVEASATPLPGPVSPPHRGRIQVQGLDMAPELSSQWAQATPPTSAEGVQDLDGLQARCTATQLRHRREAFPKARRYIEDAAGRGVDAPVSRTFQDRGLPKTAKDARVDIEVVYGRAFV